MTSEDAQRLAAAIVQQAVDDYLAADRARLAAEKIKREQPDENEAWWRADAVQRRAYQTRSECVEFIRSDWFSTLTDIEPERLIARLKQLRGRRIKREGTT